MTSARDQITFFGTKFIKSFPKVIRRFTATILVPQACFRPSWKQCHQRFLRAHYSGYEK